MDTRTIADSALEPADRKWMARAIELAARGEGFVEPNPMVGCVVVRNDQIIAEGFHERFGGPHAEVNALKDLSSEQLENATVYITLEPCSHHGKTPPCSDLLCQRRPARIVVAMQDPFSEVAGKGLERIRQANLNLTVGVLFDEAESLCAPYLKLIRAGRPWLIAKWAMSLDGKIASRSGHSQWISSPESRRQVHAIRGRMDAIIVGINTVLADDPQLTPRPPGPRIPTRIIMDSQARIPLDGNLANSARQYPSLVVTSSDAADDRISKLQSLGLEVWVAEGDSRRQRLERLLDELGRRRMTNILVEGGGTLLGALHDADLIDEVHAFIAPVLVGGQKAITPIQGTGTMTIDLAKRLGAVRWQSTGQDCYFTGRLLRQT